VTTLAALPTGAARRIVFLGTPEIAVGPLRALVAAGVDVALVVTRVDKRRGRGGELSPSPVKRAAMELGIPVSHRLEDALTVGADLGVVVAYGRIIPATVLERLAMINVHFSLLPRWRGAAPVERALLAGDEKTGICIMRVEEGLDTGVVYARVVVPIRPDHTLTSLREELVTASLPPLIQAVTRGCGTGEPQVGEPVHAAKVLPGELEFRFIERAGEIVAKTKLETAWFTFHGKRIRVLRAESITEGNTDTATTSATAEQIVAGTVLKVSREGVEVQCRDGAIRLLEVQPEGRAAMKASEWANGARLASSLA
jgi:methionyl-tRNA formyltransferase